MIFQAWIVPMIAGALIASIGAGFKLTIHLKAELDKLHVGLPSTPQALMVKYFTRDLPYGALSGLVATLTDWSVLADGRISTRTVINLMLTGYAGSDILEVALDFIKTQFLTAPDSDP